jgi:hypothetical protein
MKGYNRKKTDKGVEEPETKMGERQEDGMDKKVPMELAKITQDLQCSIDKTQFIMQHHLDETREHLSRGQVDLKSALTTIEQGQEFSVTTLEAGQERIAHLLMQMVHGRESQNNEGNNGVSGSHGGERYHAETSHKAHTEGQSLFGGANNRVQGSSRVTPKPYMPSFLDAQQQDAHVPGRMEVEDNFEVYGREFATFSARFRRQVSLGEYCSVGYVLYSLHVCVWARQIQQLTQILLFLAVF